MDTRAILAVDVDGVLRALGPLQSGWSETVVHEGGRQFVTQFNPDHGGQLLALAEETGAELTWCTTWERLANEHIAPLVGLPELPWVPMAPGRAGQKFSEYRSVGKVKARALAAYAGERPVVWFDDESDATRELESCHQAPHRVVYVKFDRGLQDWHLEVARTWLLSL